MSTSGVTFEHNRPYLDCIAFLTAFCSISYELLIGTELSRILGEGIFIYPGCIGTFILFKGIGSAFWYRKSEKIEHISLSALLITEFLLTATGYCSILVIHLCRTSLLPVKMNPIFCGFLFASLIGLLTGQELGEKPSKRTGAMCSRRLRVPTWSLSRRGWGAAPALELHQ